MQHQEEGQQAREANDRRMRIERRNHNFRSMLYAMVYSRRRDMRRNQESGLYYTDWYGMPLFVTAITIVLLCCADAFLTLELITRGGTELNPFMDYLLGKGFTWFVGVKMALTIGAILLLVMHHRFHFVKNIRASQIMALALVGYGVLVCYEIMLLRPLWSAT